MRTTKPHGRGRAVTVWVPDELDQKIDRILADRIAKAAQAGRLGRQLPTRHEWMLEAVRAAIDAARAHPAPAQTPSPNT